MRIQFVSLLVVAVVAFDASAQDEPKKTDAFAEKRERVRQVVVKLAEKPIELLPGPLYTYEEVIDKWHAGTSWVWGANGRPVAFLNMMTQGQTRYFEFISLTNDKPKVSMGAELDWRPKPNWDPKVIKNAKAPASSRTRRLIQMRSLARRFQGKQVHYGDIQRLRGLPQPIYRYATESDESLDGAIFAHLRETDLETILVIEAQKQKDGTSKWVFDCKPVSIDYQEMRFDDKTVWERKRISYAQAGQRSAPYHIHRQRVVNQ